MAGDPPPPLDAKVLGDLRELQNSGSPGLLAELIDLFLKQGEEKMAEMRKAIQSKDGALLGRHAHTLKGSAGSLGALALSGLCRELEGAVRAGAWADAASRAQAIETEFARVKAALGVERDR